MSKHLSPMWTSQFWDIKGLEKRSVSQEKVIHEVPPHVYRAFKRASLMDPRPAHFSTSVI